METAFMSALAATAAVLSPADATAATKSREIAIPAEDGYALAATLFAAARCSTPPLPLVVIAAGAAIARRFYARFATYLAERGATVLTFDYRAIGGSRRGPLKGSPVRMRDWCTARRAGRARPGRARTFPGRPLHWVGHSMGGFATGLAHNNHLVARQLNVATLSGYWGRMAVPERYRVLLHDGRRGAARRARDGYLPGRLMGGEDMPGPAFLEWRSWCMSPGFLFDDATLPERDNFARLTRAAARRSRSPTTPGARRPPSRHHDRALHRQRATARIWHVTPADAGVAKIGHFGFFRPELRDTLWSPPPTGCSAIRGQTPWRGRAQSPRRCRRV